MTLGTIGTVRQTIRDTGDLCEALGIRFSDEQLAAITAPLEPAVVIAGAGSGKTTVMAARVVWLVGKGLVRPEQVLGLTFTRKAAAELAARVRQALQRAGVLPTGLDEAGEEVIMTYDAFAGRLVADFGQRIGVETDPMLITGAARYRLAARVVAAASGPFDHLDRLRPNTLAERLLALDSDLAAHLMTADEVTAESTQYLRELASAPLNNRRQVYVSVKDAVVRAHERLELLGLVDDYQELKRRLGLVEFADQMRIAAKLVAHTPRVAEAMREQFAVVLLDEYQDTSSAQVQVLRGLFSGDHPHAGRGHPVTAVGDPFQAIYGWRGAAASNILAFHREFPAVDGGPATRYQLGTNRRSGPQVLAAANDVADGPRADPVLADGDPESIPVPLVAPDSAPDAVVRAAAFSTWPDEVAWLTDQVVAAHEGGPAARWSDIAVLVRRNADIAAVHAALTQADVPVEIVGLGGLLYLPEVADVVATLTLVNDVTANPEVVRLLAGPRWRIGPVDLARLGQRARELSRGPRSEKTRDLAAELDDVVAGTDPTEIISLVDALDHLDGSGVSAEGAARMAEFSRELAGLRQHAAEPVLDQVRRVIALLGLDIELDASRESTRARRADQLEVFTDSVADYVDVDGDTSLAGLLAWFDAERQHGVGLDQATPSAQNSVKLLTVHRAKGLEWTVVLLPALVDGVFPSDRVTDNWVKNPAVLPAALRGDAEAVPQLTEASDAGFKLYDLALKQAAGLSEDRLAYVAITRAKRVLVASTHQWRAGLLKPRHPSRYFTVLARHAESGGGDAVVLPTAGDVNPLEGPAHAASWPVPPDQDAALRRRLAAELVEQARVRHETTRQWDDASADPLTLDEAALVSQWDDLLDRMAAEAAEQARRRTTVLVPRHLSATQVVQSRSDPDAFARRVLRPMPQPVSAAADLGSRFHAWLESRAGVATLSDPALFDDLVAEPVDEPLERLQRAFQASRWADRLPLAVEVPFVLVLGDSQVRGRIDAVYPAEGPDHDVVIVDWKTSTAPADPLQLAIYRLAWSQSHQVPLERVDAVFVHVSSGEVVRPVRWPATGELEAWITSAAEG